MPCWNNTQGQQLAASAAGRTCAHELWRAGLRSACGSVLDVAALACGASDAPAHKHVTLPREERGGDDGVHPHEVPEPTPDVVDTNSPPGSESVLPSSFGEGSSSTTELRPARDEQAASSGEHAAASFAMSACKVFGLVTKNIEPWDPLYDCPAANKAKQGEINNMASNDVLDMASLDEWGSVRAKDPSAEMVGGKMLIGIKDYEELGQSSLDDANWKARLVCTGNFIRNAAEHVVWSVDSMYAAPVDLHNARLVVGFGAKLCWAATPHG